MRNGIEVDDAFVYTPSSTNALTVQSLAAAANPGPRVGYTLLRCSTA